MHTLRRSVARRVFPGFLGLATPLLRLGNEKRRKFEEELGQCPPAQRFRDDLEHLPEEVLGPQGIEHFVHHSGRNVGRNVDHCFQYRNDQRVFCDALRRLEPAAELLRILRE